MDQVLGFDAGLPDQQDRKVSADNPYRFRLLGKDEATNNPNFLKDPNQFDLTRKLLKRPELRPTGVLDIDGNEFLVGKIIKSRDGGRDQAVMFYRDKRTGVLLPRVLYKSMSDGGWRSCPGTDKGERGSLIYSKGNDIHYTQETKPHENLVRYLEEAETVGHVATRGKGEDLIYDYFNTMAGYTPWNTFSNETSEYNDLGALMQFQRYPPGEYATEDHGPNPNIAGRFRAFDFSDPRLAGFLPDFQTPAAKRGKTIHTLLGPVNTEVYTAQLNQRPIEWVFAYDNKGRVWIDRIAFLDTKVNSYGVSPQVIDSGALTNKPIEYRELVSALVKGKDYHDFGMDRDYVDITPLLNNLLPIQEFKKAKSLYLENTAEQSQVLRVPAPSVQEANSFDELLSIFTKGRGLQGSGHFFSAPEILQTIAKVRRGELDPDRLTRSEGLRETVLRLMAQEKQAQQDKPINIADARDFGELYHAIRQSKGLQGSSSFYSASELIEKVNQVRRGEIRLDFLTRTGGLRDAVVRLLNDQK